MLTLDDLPSGFEELSPVPVQFGDECFAFLDEARVEIVMGCTRLLATDSDKEGFDLHLQLPDTSATLVAIGVLGSSEIVEQEALTGLDDIGDEAAGVTLVVKVENSRVRIDTVVFRREMVGVDIFVIYRDGSIPVPTVGGAARALDAKIETLLAGE